MRVSQLQPWVCHHLVDVGSLDGVRLEKFLQQTGGSCEHRQEDVRPLCYLSLRK